MSRVCKLAEHTRTRWHKHNVTSRKSGPIKTVLSQILPALVHFPLRHC